METTIWCEQCNGSTKLIEGGVLLCEECSYEVEWECYECGSGPCSTVTHGLTFCDAECSGKHWMEE